MKKNRLLLILPLLVLFGSCKKFLDVNKNPNSPNRAPINGLLGQATYQTTLNTFRAGNLSAYYVQYFASSNTSSPTDIYESVDASSTWTNLYNTMTDIYDLDKLGGELGAKHHQGIARILMSVNLKMAHDIWGDVPYTEAFAGEIVTPAYDDAKSVYQKSLALLDEGIALLEEADPAVELDESLDFIHHGDTDAWIKTANALKARLLIQATKTPEFNADAVLLALQDGYTENGDDAQITDFDVRNPWAQVALNNAALLLDGWMSDQYINMMNGTTYGVFDPRLPLLVSKTKYNDYRGTRNGKGRVGSGINFEESYLEVNGAWSSTNSPLIIIGYAETQFIKAEALFRKNNKEDAYDAYVEGIKASMAKVGVSGTETNTYINNANVSVGEAALTIDDIMREKYKALFLSPETWNDARRYNYAYEGFQLPLNSVLTEYIRRMDYPSVETSRNGSNVPEVSGLDERLWWDQ